MTRLAAGVPEETAGYARSAMYHASTSSKMLRMRSIRLGVHEEAKPRRSGLVNGGQGTDRTGE
jgi:hypothetical protein